MANELMKGGANLVTGGTDNHMMVIDCVKSWNMPGKDCETLWDKIGITTNKSPIPDDPNPPFNPSGVRLGTPAATTRGMKENEMKKLASWMIEAINKQKEKKELERIKKEVTQFCKQFPVPGL